MRNTPPTRPGTDANGQSELSKLLEDQNEGGGIGQYDTRMAIYEVLQGLTDMLNGKTCFEIAHETYMEAYPQYSDGYAEAQSVKAQIEALPATITFGTEVRCGSSTGLPTTL